MAKKHNLDAETISYYAEQIAAGESVTLTGLTKADIDDLTDEVFEIQMRQLQEKEESDDEEEDD